MDSYCSGSAIAVALPTMNRRSATLHDSLGRPLVLLPVLGAVVTFLVIFGISGALNCTSKVLPNASLNEPLELHAGNSSARCKQTATWAGFDEASNDLARDAREVFGLWRERGGFSRQHVSFYCGKSFSFEFCPNRVPVPVEDFQMKGATELSYCTEPGTRFLLRLPKQLLFQGV